MRHERSSSRCPVNGIRASSTRALLDFSFTLFAGGGLWMRWRAFAAGRLRLRRRTLGRFGFRLDAGQLVLQLVGRAAKLGQAFAQRAGDLRQLLRPEDDER